MNLQFRAKLFGRIRLSSLSSLLQSNSYATSKTPKPFNPNPPKSPPNFSDRIAKPTGDVIVWPKPLEIPYQAKVANFVKLVGFVKAPVQFDTFPGGKHYASTAISQEIGGGNVPLLIPVVFEGDLAHVVAGHVKQNDCVLVSGQLSSDPLLPRFAKSDGWGKLHILGGNLNFVEGFAKGGFVKNVVEGAVDEKFDQQWEKAVEDAKVERFSGEANWGSGSVKVESNAGAMPGSGEVKLEKKRDWDRGLDLWRDLVKNSLLWWDYRDQKVKGMVKEKHPDFKHKETGDGLWVDSAPKWVLPGIGKLEFDVPVVKVKFVRGAGYGGGERKGSGKDEDSWKDLVENPSKWWDNRANKQNPKWPDFKHKETQKALWLSGSPEWVLSKLPPST
ncbi:protein OSB2, chloroplastic-like [Salvia hispanica]|uniref:protein OSB2, chloroplastic-like n=1 Tax=Salvia hispanica TaxID=49212 RepID=UPI0020093CA8|nr:protein OSB2, chloroplastic-like [Salvia hispanica]